MTAALLNGGGAPAPTPEGRPSTTAGAPHTLDNGVDMRTTLTLTGIAAGIALTITIQRWTPTALWWLFGAGR